MVITLSKKLNRDLRSDSDVIIDLDEQMENYKAGDIICKIDNYGCLGSPISLEFAIRKNGDIIFRAWGISKPFTNGYAYLKDDFDQDKVTDEQKKTIADLIAGRKKFRGVKIGIGRSIQNAVGGLSSDLFDDNTIWNSINENWIPVS